MKLLGGYLLRSAALQHSVIYLNSSDAGRGVRGKSCMMLLMQRWLARLGSLIVIFACYGQDTLSVMPTLHCPDRGIIVHLRLLHSAPFAFWPGLPITVKDSWIVGVLTVAVLGVI